MSGTTLGAPEKLHLTTYTKRDLRAVDLLTLVLFSVGIVLVLVALIRPGRAVLLWIGAVSTISLGTALKLKLRQLLRNLGSEEPNTYAGVFELFSTGDRVCVDPTWFVTEVAGRTGTVAAYPPGVTPQRACVWIELDVTDWESGVTDGAEVSVESVRRL